MRKIILILMILLLIPASVCFAERPQYESITVANTAIGFTSAKIADIKSRIVCTLETAQIRFRVDSVDPTSTEGHLLEIGQNIELFNTTDFARFRAIRTGATSGVLKCTYW